MLAAWRDAPFCSQCERAALAWCESLTLLSQTGAAADVYVELEHLFSPEEIVELTFTIVTINSWNRLSVGFGLNVGNYSSRKRPI